MKLHIDLIESNVQHLTKEIYNTTAQIKADLTSGTVKAIEVYAAAIVPEIDPLYKTILALCDTTMKTCLLIQSFNWTGVKTQLGTLVAEIVAVKHGRQSEFGKVLSEVQIVLSVIIGH